MSGLLFDEPYYLEINEARWSVAASAIAALRSDPGIDLKTCIDVGSGPGWFAERLVELGLDVSAIEGRPELADVAARRVPGAHVRVVDVESEASVAALGMFDLVFAFGILYHTENPFRVVRNLRRLTGSVLLLETQVLPVAEPIFYLVSEGQNQTQGLTYHSLIASRPALVKMLQTAGYAWVGRYVDGVAHDDFVETAERYPRRAIYLAADRVLDVPGFVAEPPVSTGKYDFSKPATMSGH